MMASQLLLLPKLFYWDYISDAEKDTDMKETMTILHALQIWSEQFEGTWLIIHEDNTGVVNKFKISQYVDRPWTHYETQLWY